MFMMETFDKIISFIADWIPNDPDNNLGSVASVLAIITFLTSIVVGISKYIIIPITKGIFKHLINKMMEILAHKYIGDRDNRSLDDLETVLCRIVDYEDQCKKVDKYFFPPAEQSNRPSKDRGVFLLTAWRKTG